MHIEAADLIERVRWAAGAEEFSAALGQPLVVVSLVNTPEIDDIPTVAAALHRLPVVLVSRSAPTHRADLLRLTRCLDVVIDDTSTLDQITRTVMSHPVASVSLAMLLRSGERLDSDAALVVESATYSMLQSGVEFREWLKSRADRSSPPTGPAVRVDRAGSLLRVRLDRPERHNAFSVSIRDELVSVLSAAERDGSIERILLSGAGPSFCSGGELSEFGTFGDPASAHLVRLTRSIARLLTKLGERLEAHVHGWTIGAGIEMAAFAKRVVADPGTRILLPEVSMGLIPGAGGTVSLPRRIGRQRTLQLALTGVPIDAMTAQSWGLVDEIAPRIEV